MGFIEGALLVVGDESAEQSHILDECGAQILRFNDEVELHTHTHVNHNEWCFQSM